MNQGNSRKVVRLVHSLGLMTAVQPKARQEASLEVTEHSGMSEEVMSTKAPAGDRRSNIIVPESITCVREFSVWRYEVK